MFSSSKPSSMKCRAARLLSVPAAPIESGHCIPLLLASAGRQHMQAIMCGSRTYTLSSVDVQTLTAFHAQWHFPAGGPGRLDAGTCLTALVPGHPRYPDA
jgi:hypothetical protein